METKNQKNNSLLIVYFNEKAIVKNTQDAVDFINSLHYRGDKNCEKLICNESCKKLIERFFSHGDSLYRYAVTNCSETFIYFYIPLADSLEMHEELYKKQLAEKIEKERKIREEREIAFYNDIYAKNFGLYDVVLSADVIYLNGGMGISHFFYTVLAESKYDAYEKVVAALHEDCHKGELEKVQEILMVESIESAVIDYTLIYTVSGF